MITVIVETIVQGVADFFVRWYVVASRDFWSQIVQFLASLDRMFGVAMNARLITKPIYGDYSFVGRIIGPMFRLGRIVLGGCAYALLLSVAIFVWFVWVVIPMALVYVIVFD